MEQQAKLAESLLEENEAMARRYNEQVHSFSLPRLIFLPRQA